MTLLIFIDYFRCTSILQFDRDKLVTHTSSSNSTKMKVLNWNFLSLSKFPSPAFHEYSDYIYREQIKETYGVKIEKYLSGPLFNIVAKLFRVFVGIKVTVPGDFNLKDNSEAITCSHKQSHGFLYPMDKGFMYVPKPPIYIRFEEIQNINFARSDVSTKTFDLEITLKGGNSFTFSSVGKDDFDPLLIFCKDKKLPVQNVKNLTKAPTKDKYADDDEVDPYKERLKSEAAAADSDESDSDEEDGKHISIYLVSNLMCNTFKMIMMLRQMKRNVRKKLKKKAMQRMELNPMKNMPRIQMMNLGKRRKNQVVKSGKNTRRRINQIKVDLQKAKVKRSGMFLI